MPNATLEKRELKPPPLPVDAPLAWQQWTGVIACFGSLLMWAALPPVDAWPLGWIAPIPWLLLVRQEKLFGTRPYLKLWAAGFLFWLAAIHWIRLPHPILYIGWIALAFYLAFYIPVFIGLCRVAVHQLKLSLVIAAPIIFFGLELAKGHLITGFTMGSLGHSQFRWLEVIQISDLLGSYAVSALVMFVAACLARMLPWDGATWRVWPVAPLVAVMAAVLAYGHWRLAPPAEPPVAGPRIALIQGSFAVEVKTDRTMDPKINKRYFQLSRDALNMAKHDRKPLDLIVWPETMYRNALFTFDDGFEIDPKWKNDDGSPLTKDQIIADCRGTLADFSQALGTPWLTGIDRVHGNDDGRELHYNCAALVGRDGNIQGRYDKMHLVMFGEYIPFTETFPWLYSLTPVSGGAKPGESPVAFAVGNARIAPNICYETTIPHVIRNHVVALRERGEEPDILVNVTNDGWFRGSSELDMHLACGVFRAVECRKPLLIAANTGLSAWIDANGNVVKQANHFEESTHRYAEEAIIAEPNIDRRKSLYLILGDWPAAVCLVFCCVLAVMGRRK